MFKKMFPTIRVQHLPHQDGSAILEVQRLAAHYDGHPALSDVHFTLKLGERVAVVGPNGAGKSTLFKVIAGVLPASQGQVKIFGSGPGHHICIAYVPQRSQVDWNFPVSVSDVVMMGRIGQIGLFRWPRARDREYVHHCLELVGLQEKSQHQIGELSGGQQQRMFIARALAQQAELMLMDEPFAGLDIPSRDGILRVLDTLQQHKVTVMVALHDLNLAASHFDRVMLLNRKLLGFGPPDEVISPESLVSAYGGQVRLLGEEGGILLLDDNCGDHSHSHEVKSHAHR